jgi:murein DD-endopeptidase MepM/ murein hydrolase activator NlpD
MKAAAAGLLLAASLAPAQLVPIPVAAKPAPALHPPLPVLIGTPIQGGLVRGKAAAGVTSLTLDGRRLPLAPDGHFLFGFDRDAAPTATMVQTHAGGSDTVVLSVAPRNWAIERVDAPYRAGKTDAEFEAARPAELAAIVAARSVRTAAQGWRQPLRWPATGRHSGRFGSQRVYQGKPGSYHGGDDIAAPVGTPVVAPADGVVILAADRPFTLEGNLLMIDHGNGLNSALLHLSRIDVAVGDHVRQGQPVGAVGRTGRVTGPHLHWSLQWQGAKLDPSRAIIRQPLDTAGMY